MNETETPKPPKQRDPELSAMSRITSILSDLSPESRKRVGTYVIARLTENGDLPTPRI